MTAELLAALVILQIAMGAFDTLYHHELTERLAWRHSAETELRLHAVRNWFYALLFLIAAWVEPHGALAIAILIVLAVELVITLWDFVEEDLSRKLPGTERVTHTLLAVNYGAILAFIGPMLWNWSTLPTGASFTSRGWLGALLTLSALAVAVFGARDWFASRRAPRLAQLPGAPLASSLTGDRRTVLVTGATGFVGSRLVDAFADAGHDVIALVRNREKAVGLPAPIQLVERLDQIPSTKRIHAIVHLAGAPIADTPWTQPIRHRILRSRLKIARQIEQLVGRLEAKPAVMITASAIGFYGEGGDDQLTEADRPDAKARLAFSHRSCAAFESAANRLKPHGVRVVNLRIGLVLDHSGGLLARMLPSFDLGLGGRIGDGRQWMSWIHRDDVIRLIAHAIATPDLDGALNATAPTPVRNREFTTLLGQSLGRPAFLFIPAWPIKTLLGDMGSEILLGSARILPAKALGSGFTFNYPTLDAALARAVGSARAAETPLPRQPTSSRPALASATD